MTKTIAIFGGGIAGLSAAHELVERGYEVHVYEEKLIPGGKARSIPVPDTGTDGRKNLPGEHGFRFFPRFYKHVINTMQRTPIGHGRTAFDNLTNTSRVEMAQYNKASIIAPSWFPRTIQGVRLVLNDLGIVFDEKLGISNEEFAYFGSRIWQIVTSCGERRAHEYEKIAWWDFIGAEERSDAYQKFLGHGITRSLVAAKAKLASTKTIGDIFVQLIFDIVEPGASTDRVLNGPTNEAWIDPWLAYLRSMGLHYHLGTPLRSIECDGEKITGAVVEIDGKRQRVEADVYLSAVPVEKMMTFLTPEILTMDPHLAGLKELGSRGVSWMNGLQIYLTEDVELIHGHTIYLDSQWALTSISQKQFWPDIDLSQYGDGKIKGIISIDISDWDTPGLNGKTAKECTREEVMRESWAQIKKSINVEGAELLKDEYLHHWFLDPDIYRNAAGEEQNSEPLLVNLVDTWRFRPTAQTKIPNLFLASDYVRTFTDLATMEGANEAARRSVNDILTHFNSTAPKCDLWPLTEPALFAPLREFDQIRWDNGLPWDDTLTNLALDAIEVAAQGSESLGDLLGGWTRMLNVPIYGEAPGVKGDQPAPGHDVNRNLSIFESGLMQFFQNLQQAQIRSTKLPTLRGR